MNGELLRLQFSALNRHYGSRSRPVKASEHWRYGAFLYCLRRVQTAAQLDSLIEVVNADPDLPMARAMRKEVLSHPMATEDLKRPNNALQPIARSRAPAERKR